MRKEALQIVTDDIWGRKWDERLGGKNFHITCCCFEKQYSFEYLLFVFLVFSSKKSDGLNPIRILDGILAQEPFHILALHMKPSSLSSASILIMQERKIRD